MIKALKNKKGFTLMELIVVLIIVAVLMAALLPSLIGWINESRESALKVDGRTALLAIQSVTAEAKGLDRWAGQAAGSFTATGITRAAVAADTKFISLIVDSNLYPNATGAPDPGRAAGSTTNTDPSSGQTGVRAIFLDGQNNVIGVAINNTVRPTRNIDNLHVADGALPIVGAGLLLVGQRGALAPPGGGA